MLLLNKNTLSLVLAAQMLASCQSVMSSREKTLLAITGSAAVGAAIGSSRPDEKSKNALMYGSLLATSAAVVSLFVFDDTKKQKELLLETEDLRRANEILKAQVDPKIQAQGSSLLNASLPNDLKRLIHPGGWKRYRLDRWVQDEANENVWFRQTEMFEVTLPTANAN